MAFLVAFTGLYCFFCKGWFQHPIWVFLFVCGVLYHPFWWWSDWTTIVVWITGGYWWPLVNPLNPFWRSFLARPKCSMLLGFMIFDKRDQWNCEHLDPYSFVGEELLPNSCTSYIWLASFVGTFVTLLQRRRRDKELEITICHLYFLVLDLYNRLWSQCTKNI